MLPLKYLVVSILFASALFEPSLNAAEKQPADSNTGEKTLSKRDDGLTPLNKQETVLLDVKGKRVLVKSKVVLREGLLEMFACLKQTKEHESILAVDAKAYTVHAGLLAIGAKPGKPTRFVKPDPKNPEKFVEDYQPATGQRIEIFVQWKDKKGKLNRVSAKHWLRNATQRFYVEKYQNFPKGLTLPEKGDIRMLQYDPRNHELSWFGPITEAQRDKMLALSHENKFQAAIKSFYQQSRPRKIEADFLFTGSAIYKDPKTKQEHYRAEGGTLICVANFPSAMIDVSLAISDKEAEGMLLEAYAEHIPPIDTEVTIELIPVPDKK